MSLSTIRLGYKNQAWFNANGSFVLKEGQMVYLEQTGTYKIGDGTTILSALDFKGGTAENGIPAGGTTGQILAKVNNTDYNVTWIDPPSGSVTLPNTLVAFGDSNSEVTSDANFNFNIVSPTRGYLQVYGAQSGNLAGVTFMRADQFKGFSTLELEASGNNPIYFISNSGQVRGLVANGYVHFSSSPNTTDYSYRVAVAGFIVGPKSSVEGANIIHLFEVLKPDGSQAFRVSTAGQVKISSDGAPLLINSTNNNGGKLAFFDSDVLVSYFGGAASQPAAWYMANGDEILSVDTTRKISFQKMNLQAIPVGASGLMSGDVYQDTAANITSNGHKFLALIP